MTEADRSISADVAVVGDGPAGSALAAAIHRAGVDVVLVGPDEPWRATYSAWVDEIAANPLIVGRDPWRFRTDSIAVRAESLHQLDRAYGVLDNDRLRSILREGVRHEVIAISSFDQVDAHVVFDATGWPSALADGDAPHVDWQVAYGVVLAEPPAGPLGQPMMMDFSDPYSNDSRISGDELGVTTFAYALPVEVGWLVEETVLVGPDIAPADLRPRLAARLGMSLIELDRAAVVTEEVRIPMGAPMSRKPAPGSPVPFGATAGMIHPATGYSVSASIAAAPRVADAVVQGLAGPTSEIQNVVHEAVWPPPLRRTRRLHEYGLDVLTRLDDDATRAFFETFFALDRDAWSAYLRIDTSPASLAAVMTRMFHRSSWSMRRHLMTGDPRGLLRVVRP